LRSKENQSIPIKEGLWTLPSEKNAKPRLVGHRCTDCGEVFFPKQENGRCVRCQRDHLEEIILGRRGRISTLSVVMIKPAGGYYRGPVPYAYGCVELPEGVRIRSHLVANDLGTLCPGMDVKMIIETLYEDDDGNEIVTFKFKAARESQNEKPGQSD